MKQSLDSLLKNNGIWCASSMGQHTRPGISSGFPELDQRLAGNGWPTDGVTELLLEGTGIGELRLLMPAMAYLSQSLPRWITFIAPPHTPYPPALAHGGLDLARVLLITPTNQQDILWATEKALASGSCSAVLAWPGDRLKQTDIRRLQLAAKSGHCWNILMRSARAAQQSSPAELRVMLQACHADAFADNSTLNINILKRKGGWATGVFPVQLSDTLNRMTPDFSELIVPESVTTGNPDIRPTFPAQYSSGQVSRYINHNRHEDTQLQ
jgi:hypothetical protein